MSIYLCNNGHKHSSQDNAVNCGYCKAHERRKTRYNKMNHIIAINTLKRDIDKSNEAKKEYPAQAKLIDKHIDRINKAIEVLRKD